MAQIKTKTKQDGSISYTVRVYHGRTQSGKELIKSKTFTPPEGMSKAKADKWIQEQAVLFERGIREGFVLESDMLLDDFIDKWFKEFAEKQLKPKTVHEYRLLRVRVTAALGGLRMNKIKPSHITAFYDNLEEGGIRLDSTYTATGALLKLIPDGTRAGIAKKAGIGEKTMRLVYQQATVSRQTAEKVSAAVGMPFSKAFTEHAKEGGKLNRNTVQHYNTFLSSVFSKAVQWGVIKENPCTRAEKPKSEEVDVQVLTEEEVSRLFAALEEDAPPQYSAIVQLAIGTGARRGEICGLRWSDIDLKRGTIAINRTVQFITGKGVVFTAPKTKKSRRVFKLGADRVQMLREYRTAQTKYRSGIGSKWMQEITIENGKKVKNDLLFTCWDGKPIDPNKITTWFHDFMIAHGLPPVRFHSLRHTNASLLIAAHVPITTISGRLGHAKVSTTLDFYAAAIQSADAAAADALDAALPAYKPKSKQA